jgi:hypothetical protein
MPFSSDEVEEEQVPSSQGGQTGGKSGGQTSESQKTTVDPNFPINSYIKYGPVKKDYYDDTNEILFDFDAVVSDSVDLSDLYFETKAEGVDSGWQRTSQKSRTVKFPDGSHEYTFYVRGRTDSLTEPTPASFTIEINVSPYFDEITIIDVDPPDANANPSLVTITNNLPSGQTANITGWTLYGEKGSVTIPSGAEKYNPDDSSSWQNGDIVYISSKESPFGSGQVSFRPNKCMGYYLNSITFKLPISRNCPTQYSSNLPTYLSEKCKNFISQNVGTCEFPNPTEMSEDDIYDDVQCVDYMNLNYNYKGCFRNYSNDSNFTEPRWHIYTNRGEREIIDRYGDTVYLKDSNGLIAAKYCFEEYCN